MENFEEIEPDSKLIEIRPIQLKRTEKANSETLVKRYYCKNNKHYEMSTSLLKAILSHRIDNSPRLRSFNI
jgi:hypothetical protein